MNLDIQIANKHWKRNYANSVYIGRGSPLGNSFIIGTHGDRASVIAQYETHLRERIAAQDHQIMGALINIADLAQRPGGVKLICYCAPRPCHGDIIRKIILENVNA